MKSMLLSVIGCLILGSPAWAQYDDIVGFRVLSENQNELVLEIHSYYTGSHGKMAYISVLPTVNGNLSTDVGYSAGRCPKSNNIGIGSNRTCMTLSSVSKGKHFVTNGLRICIFGGPNRNPFHCENFGHSKQWGVTGGITNQQSPPPGGSNARPDLIIANVWWEPNSPVVQPGTSIHFSFQIKNIGNAPTSHFVRVVGPGNYSGGFSGGLRVGESKVATIDYPVYSRAATYRFTFTVDGENTIPESNENNNSSRQITIQTSY